MSLFAYWNLVTTVVLAGLCFSFITLRRRYHKRWMDNAATACIVGAFISLVVSLVRA